MSFDAGSIESTLTLDRSPFQRGLDQARADADRFTSQRFDVKIGVSTTDARSQLVAFRRAEADKQFRLKVDATTTAARASIVEFRRTERDKQFKLGVDVATTKAASDLAAWRREQAVAISESDRQEILALGEDLPRLWDATTTTSADRKQIVRLVIKEVTLDQKLLQVAARFLSDKNPQEAAVKELVSKLQGVYVRVYEFDKPGEYQMSDIEPIRSQINASGWTKIVGVMSRREGQKVDVRGQTSEGGFQAIGQLRRPGRGRCPPGPARARCRAWR